MYEPAEFATVYWWGGRRSRCCLMGSSGLGEGEGVLCEPAKYAMISVGGPWGGVTGCGPGRGVKLVEA